MGRPLRPRAGTARHPTDWAAAWRAFKGLDVQGRLAEFEPPALVLAGEFDASTTPEIMDGIRRRIPGSSFIELPGTPHMQTLERPELVSDALDAFLPSAQEARQRRREFLRRLLGHVVAGVDPHARQRARRPTARQTATGSP